ncbi:uncharacterized protein BJ171DRAFT_600985 [Polychytrium aggregatum]|uniref:uncharacterized protein n=1 Tax=Polychytrium aggregatum TaxID=110093 RepID=UPI0022FDBF6D|nr:uncharacterized protein BJ171DRAFT_600985 [Polychytrium aggregatum]KAI9202290.1 hypothetical protein BJ171DRAFT_600985 [Polychytrium aggregatum]
MADTGRIAMLSLKRKSIEDHHHYHRHYSAADEGSAVMQCVSSVTESDAYFKRMKPTANPQLVSRSSPNDLAALSEPPISPQTSRPGLHSLLATLDRSQLQDLVASLVEQHPQLDSDVRGLMPALSIPHAKHTLLELERRLNETFPYSRWGPDRCSDYAFNRVAPALAALQDSLVFHLDYFTEPRAGREPEGLAIDASYPVDALAYLHLATEVVHRLPVWQNPSHNLETRIELYRRLARQWRLVLVEIGRRLRDQGRLYGTTLVSEWARNLGHHCRECNGDHGFSDAYEELKIQLGWLVGLYPATIPSSHPEELTTTEVDYGFPKTKRDLLF